MAFPIQRLRRLRQHEALRRMVRQTRLSVDQVIYPLFVRPGRGVRLAIRSMPEWRTVTRGPVAMQPGSR